MLKKTFQFNNLERVVFLYTFGLNIFSKNAAIKQMDSLLISLSTRNVMEISFNIHNPEIGIKVDDRY